MGESNQSHDSIYLFVGKQHTIIPFQIAMYIKYVYMHSCYNQRFSTFSYCYCLLFCKHETSILTFVAMWLFLYTACSIIHAHWSAFLINAGRKGRKIQHELLELKQQNVMMKSFKNEHVGNKMIWEQCWRRRLLNHVSKHLRLTNSLMNI